MTAISPAIFHRSRWQTVLIFALTFWLSSSLILDLVIMPELYATGMMTQPGFASASYSIFWLFNRIELVCAALVLTSTLLLYKTQTLLRPGTLWAIGLPLMLFTTALFYTYGLTPAMSSLGLQLDWFDGVAEVPAAMNQMHQSYWALEVLKLVTGAALLKFYYNRAYNRTQR
jgi:hypothetical protein